MPIPTPRKGEKRDDFLPRCIKVVVGEGTPQKQAVAICSQKWRDRKKQSKQESSNLHQILTVDRLTNIKLRLDQIKLAEKKKKTSKRKRRRQEKRKPVGRKIKQEEDGWSFQIWDYRGANQSVRTIEDGVVAYSAGQSAFVDTLYFSSNEFPTFEEVREWLTSAGFEVSPERQLEVEAEFEDDGLRIVYLEEVSLLEVEEAKYEEVEIEGTKVLAAQALAIAPGTWKDFTFSLAVIHEALDLYDGVGIVEHHRYSEPEDVKGWVFLAESTKDGIVTSFIVRDPVSITKMQDGKLNAVSSNFLLTVDDDNNVEEINKVVELTLTGNPACKPCQISAQTGIELSGNHRQPPTKEAILGGIRMEGQENGPSVQLEEENARLQASLKEANEKLDKSVALSESSQKQSKELQQQFEAISKRLEKSENAQLEMQADRIITKFEKEDKITAGNREAAKAIFLSDQAENFEKFLTNAQFLKLEEEKGYTEQEGPNGQQNSQELEDEIDKQLKEVYDHQTGRIYNPPGGVQQ